MSENIVPMSDWEWEGVVNTPERKEAADRRYAKEQQNRAEKEEFLSNFYEKNQQRRKTRVEIEACRYTMAAIVCGAVAYYCGLGGIRWLAWAVGIGAGIFALIAAYGFGKIKEMKRR